MYRTHLTHGGTFVNTNPAESVWNRLSALHTTDACAKFRTIAAERNARPIVAHCVATATANMMNIELAYASGLRSPITNSRIV